MHLPYYDTCPIHAEHDFQSISRIGDSVKRKQTGKTGRFG